MKNDKEEERGDTAVFSFVFDFFTSYGLRSASFTDTDVCFDFCTSYGFRSASFADMGGVFHLSLRFCVCCLAFVIVLGF